MKKGHQFLSLTLVLIVVAIALAGCGLDSEPAGRIPGPDWSRGLPLSSNIGGTAGMLAQESTGAIHFVWPTAADDQAHIHYLRLDREAKSVADFDLALRPGRQRTPRLAAADDNNLHLFWANREANARGWTLWHAILDQHGSIIGQPTQVSPEGMRVGDYTLVRQDRGDALAIWEQDSAQGLWAASVSLSGNIGEPVRLTESGDSPDAYLEKDGTLHLTWAEELGIQYASYAQGELGLTKGVTVADRENIIANIDGPVVGVGGDWVYILWSIFARSGLEAGNGWTEFVAFPKSDYAAGDLVVPPATRVWMLTDEVQPYDPYDGAYALTQLVPAVTSPALSGDYILEPDPDVGRGNELAVAVAAKQLFRMDEVVQMAVLLFKDGEFDGYQMAAKTDSFSLDGILQSDSAGNLYLAWREGTGRQLYFAATQPALRSELNHLNQTDFVQALVGGGLEALTGALFFPLSLIWFVPGGLLLGIWKLRRDDETIDDSASRILLIAAIVLYQGTKILFLPSIMTYVPFSAWLDVPPGLGTLLRIMVPILSFALGILVAEWVRRRKEGASSLLYFFAVCGVDAIITLMVYGVNLLGVM
ncbi:MAG: hypothetical protein PVG33_04430 [Chloroflexota bacterium]|jgi:hypothetical protein